MKNLSENEKVMLVIFTVFALTSLVISVYLCTNLSCHNNGVLNRRIYILDTVGNINSFEKEYRNKSDKISHFDINSYSSVVDSSNITLEDWNQIAREIAMVYDMYDAFVVVAGNDTMVYTASALSFQLENLGKPVICTEKNVIDAMVIASNTRIPEVMIYSDQKLYRGNRAIQYSDNIFSTPNFPSLSDQNCFLPPLGEFTLQKFNPIVKVALVKVFPNMDYKQFIGLLNDKTLHGLILELYVDGANSLNKKILSNLKLLRKQGVIIVATSENGQNHTHKLPNELSRIGVLSAGDMTPSCAYTKLCFLLSNLSDRKLIRELIKIPLRGEVSEISLEEKELVDSSTHEHTDEPIPEHINTHPARYKNEAKHDMVTELVHVQDKETSTQEYAVSALSYGELI